VVLSQFMMFHPVVSQCVVWLHALKCAVNEVPCEIVTGKSDARGTHRTSRDRHFGGLVVEGPVLRFRRL